MIRGARAAFHYAGGALREVLVRPSYAALASGIAVLALVVAIWLPNLGLLAQVFADAQAPMQAKLGFALSLLGGIATSFSLFSAAYTMAIAALLGVNSALMVYLVRRKRLAAAGKNLLLGSGGVATGLVGIGCAACGSLILGGLFPSLALAGALAALPLQGEELGILSVALLFVSLLFLGRSIAGPAVCDLRGGAR